MFIFFHTRFFEAGHFKSADCEDTFFLFSHFGKKSPKLMQYEDIWKFLHLLHPWISGGSCN